MNVRNMTEKATAGIATPISYIHQLHKKCLSHDTDTEQRTRSLTMRFGVTADMYFNSGLGSGVSYIDSKHTLPSSSHQFKGTQQNVLISLQSFSSWSTKMMDGRQTPSVMNADKHIKLLKVGCQLIQGIISAFVTLRCPTVARQQ